MHAFKLNAKVLNPLNPGQAMDERLLVYWRRKCFLQLNEASVQVFISNDWKAVCGALELVSELVVPCIHQLSASSDPEDSLAVEHVRNCWCNFLGKPLDGTTLLVEFPLAVFFLRSFTSSLAFH